MHPHDLREGYGEFLRPATELGDWLIVACTPTPPLPAKRRPVMTTRERVHMVAAGRCVDEVLPTAARD